MTLDPDDERPAYVQVADALRGEIRSGALKAGDRLPSARELAERYKIAPMTARNAIRLLREQGLVVSRQGSGAFVRETAAQTAGGDSATTELEQLRKELLDMQERLALAEQTGAAVAAIQASLDRISARLDAIERRDSQPADDEG